MDVNVTPTSPPLPLTRKNLRALTKMSSRSPSSQKSKSQPSMSTGDSTAHSSSNARLRTLLARLHINVGRKSYTEHAETNQLIATLISQERSSPGMTEAKAKALVNVSRKVSDRNAADSIQALLPLIYPEPEYFEQGKPSLERSIKVCFEPGCIPKPKGPPDNPRLQALLASLEAPPTPHLDVAFGIENSSWSALEAFINDEINELYGRLAHPFGVIATSYPFLITQWTSQAAGGNQFQAANQAASGGAALLGNMQKLLAATADTCSLTEEDRTHLNTVFSVTTDSESVHIYVHWSEPIPGTSDRSYEMSIVKRVMLDCPDMFPAMQRMVNNIIDWGLLERRAAIKKVIALQMAQIDRSS